MQDFVAIAIVFLAAVYLGRVAWQSMLSRSSGCSSCSSCSSSNAPQVVQIKGPSHRNTKPSE